MTKNGMVHTVFHCLAGAVIIVLALCLCKSCRNTEPEYIKVEVRDTIQIPVERIVEHTRVQYVTRFDTLVRYISDTDTVEIPVEIPIEHKIYQDTLKTDTTQVEMAIKYSGFKASLDSVGISYHFEGERPVNVKKSGFSPFVGVGAYVGAGVGYNPIDKNVGMGCPEVGIGVIIGWGYHWK